MSDLPDSWLNIKLGDVVDYGVTSKIEPAEIAKESWILELEDIEKASSKLTQRISYSERQSKSTKNKFEANDVLYGKLRPYLDKVIIAKEAGYCTTEIIPIKSGKYLDNRFLFYGLKRKEFLDYVSEVSHGLNMPRLGTKQGQEAPFILAPLNEQIRIADKLDSLLAKVDEAQARLEKIPTLLKRFRQSVLAAATSGGLTHEWSEINNQKNLWQYLVTKDVCLKITDGEHQTPKRVSKGEILLSAKNIRDGFIDYSNFDYISSEDFQKCIKRCNAEVNDVLIVSVGATIGRVAIKKDVTSFALVRSVGLFKPNSNKVVGDYLMFSLQAPDTQKHIQDISRGNAQPTLYIEPMSNIPIKLPSILEQTEIVRRVESLFAQADAVEQQYRAAKQRLDRLSQSLLAKAFRGELVPQDPTDEPAAELLKRIQAERQAQTPAKRQRSAPI